MVFYPEHPKRDQNPKFTPLSATTSIPTPFICGVPPALGYNSTLLIYELQAWNVLNEFLAFFSDKEITCDVAKCGSRKVLMYMPSVIWQHLR